MKSLKNLSLLPELHLMPEVSLDSYDNGFDHLA